MEKSLQRDDEIHVTGILLRSCSTHSMLDSLRVPGGSVRVPGGHGDDGAEAVLGRAKEFSQNNMYFMIS